MTQIKEPVREPLTVEELYRTIPLADVTPWVESLCSRYNNPEWSNFFVEKRGLTNKLQGELVPLALLCHQLAPDRPNASLKYFYGSKQSFDAQVIAGDDQVEEVLEVTLACDGYRESIASEYLLRYGWAQPWVPLTHSGRRNNRELPLPEIQSMDAEQIVEDGLLLIRNAVEAKSASGKYGNVSLVVGFDDFRLLHHHFEYAKTELLKIKSKFLFVYYVGLRGRFFYAQRTCD